LGEWTDVTKSAPAAPMLLDAVVLRELELDPKLDIRRDFVS